MRLRDYPLGIMAFAAGVDADGNVVRSNSVVTHDHDADYAPLVHDHDADYAQIVHNHDADYAPLVHNHDADYAPLVHSHSNYALAEGSLVLTAIEWEGGQTLPYSFRTISDAIEPQLIVIMRDDGYMGLCDMVKTYNVVGHVSYAYAFSAYRDADYTWLTIPTGATWLNVSGSHKGWMLSTQL